MDEVGKAWMGRVGSIVGKDSRVGSGRVGDIQSESKQAQLAGYTSGWHLRSRRMRCLPARTGLE